MPATSQDHELRAAGDRIEILMGELAAASPAVRGKAEELVRLLMQLYGAGLDRILSAVDDAGQAAAGPILAKLAADDLVASLLVLHDLHPLDLEARVARALDHVRPDLGSHGDDVELLGVADGVVRLRLAGKSSTAALRQVIEKAIQEAAPDIARIEVEGSLVQIGGRGGLKSSASSSVEGGGTA